MNRTALFLFAALAGTSALNGMTTKQAEPRKTVFEFLLVLAKKAESQLSYKLDDKKLIQEAMAEFESTCNFEHSIPLICAQAHITPEKAERFIHTHQQYSMLLSQSNIYSNGSYFCYIHALNSDYQIAGDITFTHQRGKYHITMLQVNKDHRRQGIASMLLLSAYATIVAHARAQGQSTAIIFWEALPQGDVLSTEQLIQFYRDHGAQLEEGKPNNTMTITIPWQ